jgi:hypothetical protein
MPHKGRKKMAFGPATPRMAPPRSARGVRGPQPPSGPLREVKRPSRPARPMARGVVGGQVKGLQERVTDPAVLLPPLLRVAVDAFRAHLKETEAGRPRPAPPSLAPPAPPAPPRPARPALRRTAPPRLRGGQTRLTPRQLRDPRER